MSFDDEIAPRAEWSARRRNLQIVSAKLRREMQLADSNKNHMAGMVFAFRPVEAMATPAEASGGHAWSRTGGMVMNSFRHLAVAVAAGLPLMLANAANAIVFTSGSFGFTAFTSSQTDVTTTTVFPLTSPVFVGAPLDDFSGVSMPATLTLPAGAVNFGLVGCCNWTDPSLGSFIGTVAPVRMQTTPHPNGSATWDVVGLFTVGPAFTNAGAVFTADMTWSLTQTGSPSDATSISGTFHAPTVPSAPEPTTLVLLGLGLAGLAASRRRKQ